MPNYKQSPSQLCKSLTQEAVNYRSLDIIFLASQQVKLPGTDQGLSLPSWCADYLNLASKPIDVVMACYIARNSRKYRAGSQGSKWNTTGHSFPIMEVHQEERLVVHGVQCGVIKSLGALLTDRGNKYPAAQLDGGPNMVHDFQIYLGLCRVLAIYDSKYSKITAKSSILSSLDSLPFRVFASLNEGDGTLVREWFKRNQTFAIQGKTLKWRAQGFPRLNSLEMDLRRLSSAIADVIREGMRIMALSGGRVGWAHPKAQLGDHVYLISGCTMPAILRPRSNKMGFTLIGHSYVQDFMDGRYWRDVVRHADLSEVEIW